MKKWISFILFLFSVQQITLCQTSFYAEIGRTWSWLELDADHPFNSVFPVVDDLEYSAINSTVFGLQMTHSTGKNVDVNFGLQYSVKGAKEVNDELKVKLNYIKFLPSVDVNVWKNLKFGGGIYLAYLLSNQSTNSFTSFAPFNYFEDKWDSGISLAASYSIDRVNFRVSYYHGWSAVIRRYSTSVFSSTLYRLNYNNRALQFVVQYDLIGIEDERKLESKNP